jgi:hypothetical protein
VTLSSSEKRRQLFIGADDESLPLLRCASAVKSSKQLSAEIAEQEKILDEREGR